MSKQAIVLYLHVHQPWRVRDYTVFDTAIDHEYFGETTDAHRSNKAIFEKVADKSYRPMNSLLKSLLAKHPEFKLSLSITGTFIDQAEAWAPDVLEDFKQLVATGRVEVVAETYHHSLAFFYSRDEFERQVEKHRDRVKELFNVEPKTFRNTELAYNNKLAEWADSRGYEAILTEGWDPVLEWRSPNYAYSPAGTNNIALLMKNYKLSDDLAFRFSNREWEHFPLHSDKYVDWLKQSLSDDGQIINLFMDYETFGEHQWADTGIFKFFASVVEEWLVDDSRTFYTTSEAAKECKKVGEISVDRTITWADAERDLSAWLGNSLQHEAMHHLYALEHDVLHSGDEILIEDWRRLTTSDHPYYMCTKWFTDGDVHAYFSPYDSPYDAFLYFMNAIRDVRYRLMDSQHNSRNS